MIGTGTLQDSPATAAMFSQQPRCNECYMPNGDRTEGGIPHPLKRNPE